MAGPEDLSRNLQRYASQPNKFIERLLSSQPGNQFANPLRQNNQSMGSVLNSPNSSFGSVLGSFGGQSFGSTLNSPLSQSMFGQSLLNSGSNYFDWTDKYNAQRAAKRAGASTGSGGATGSWNGLSGLEGTGQWEDMLQKAAQESGVPIEVMRAVMAIESGGDPNANHNGEAVGLMAIVPEYWQETANQFGGDLSDPWTNIRTAAEILKTFHGQYGSWENAGAAYFGGGGAFNDDGSYSDNMDSFGTSITDYVTAFNNYLNAQGGVGGGWDPSTYGGDNAGAVKAASDLIGLAYVWGGESHEEGGFDCSGLTQFAYKQIGKNIPRTAAEQYAGAQKFTDPSALQPGDLIFFQFPEDVVQNGQGGMINHVAIYVGNGQFIQASSNGGTIHYRSLNESFYQQYMVGFGRY